jgi:hypothetical protein
MGGLHHLSFKRWRHLLRGGLCREWNVGRAWNRGFEDASCGAMILSLVCEMVNGANHPIVW